MGGCRQRLKKGGFHFPSYRTNNLDPGSNNVNIQTGAPLARPPVRWLIAGVLCVETRLAYLDMQELAVLAPMLRKEIGVGNNEYATIMQALSLRTRSVSFLADS